jgi:hypothetical protein
VSAAVEVRAASPKTNARARFGGNRRRGSTSTATLSTDQDFDREFQLLRRTLARQGLTQAGVEIALGLADESLILFDEASQPRVIALVEEVRDDRTRRDVRAGRPIG